MNMTTSNPTRSCRARAAWLMMLGLSLCLKAQPVLGGILEPDAVIYGNLIITNTVATAARTDLTVEARRTLSGPVLATYQMGSSPSAGNYYVLRIKLEAPPLAQPDTVQVGDTVYLVLKSGAVTLTQTAAAIMERGEVIRMDLEVGPDPGGNRLPDAWELAMVGVVGQDPDTIAPNGLTLLDNYIAGTHPNDTSGFLQVRVTLSNDVSRVLLPTRAAAGPGYEGMVRMYSLEYTTNPVAGTWLRVDNFTDIASSNQTLSYTVPLSATPQFFRGRVRLQTR